MQRLDALAPWPGSARGAAAPPGCLLAQGKKTEQKGHTQCTGLTGAQPAASCSGNRAPARTVHSTAVFLMAAPQRMCVCVCSASLAQPTEQACKHAPPLFSVRTAQIVYT